LAGAVGDSSSHFGASPIFSLLATRRDAASPTSSL
jgi:hypothetical protein